MRPIAINLPQFHEMEINNVWWGKGFTEWSHVKQAEPLFVGHNQPVRPLDGYYYDMTNIRTLVQQTEWMKRAGIYGMAYYHYWYDDRPLMNRAIEMLRDHAEIGQRYMLYWSNCDWFYSLPTQKQRKLMLHQEYGGPDNWDAHIRYLLHFFTDPRYIKIDGKPVLCIYRPGEMPHYEEMIELFRHRCMEAGMKGLYVIETMFNYGEVSYHDASDAVLYREPNCCKKYCSQQKLEGMNRNPRVFNKDNTNKVLAYQYKEATIVSTREQAKLSPEKKHYHGVFTGWDNTPRRGYNGFVFLNQSPELFQKYVEMIASHIEDQNDFLFINAWNEWAEGMYMEPSEEFGYRYLDAMAGAFSAKASPTAFHAEKDYFTDLMEHLRASRVLLLYGAGRYGKEFLNFIRSVAKDGKGLPQIIFVDDTPEKQGTRWCGVPVVSVFEGLSNYPDGLIVLCVDERSHPILFKKLDGMNVPRERIMVPEIAFLNPKSDMSFLYQHEKDFACVHALLEDPRSREILQAVLKYREEHDTKPIQMLADPVNLRYYDSSIIGRIPEGIYLDCGSFCGDTAEAYISAVHGHPGKIICCEPAPDNYKALCRAIEKTGTTNAALYQKAVWFSTGKARFQTISALSGTISDEGNITVETETIDRLIGPEKLGFLKIEINGSEYEALLGGVGAINRDHPLVAVSVYHNLEDIIRIPLLLKSLNPDYRLFLRYYGIKTLTDIVCYAVPRMEADR